MQNDNQNQRRDKSEIVFSRKIRAGRRRTYFFDVRTTRGNDYYLTITESKKRFDGNGYERHKIFLYKEDLNKFLEESTAAIDHIKSLMPGFDFDAFSHKYDTMSSSESDADNGGHGDMDDHDTAETQRMDEQEQQEQHEPEHHQDENTTQGDNDTNREFPMHSDDDDLKM